MYIAVIVAITVMLVAATPLANFIEQNPTIVMLALGFLLMIGMTLIADGFGFHVPKGLHLRRHGLLGLRRGAEHAGAAAARAAAKRQAVRPSTEPAALAREPGRCRRVLLALLAMLAELACGYPDRLFRAIGHPVSWIGRLIAALDRRLNDPGPAGGRRKAAGVARARRWSWLVGLGGRRGGRVAGGGGARADRRRPGREHAPGAAEPRGRTWRRWRGRWRRGACRPGGRRWGGSSGATWRAWTRRRWRGRRWRAWRRTSPTGWWRRSFWMAVLGLAGRRGLQGDQHRRQHDRASHGAAPRLRLGGGAARRPRQPAGVAAGGGAAGRRRPAWCRARRRAGRWRRCGGTRARHRSPNAGWPEAAMAGALGFALAGPRRYGGVLVEDAVMGRGRAARPRAGATSGGRCGSTGWRTRC